MLLLISSYGGLTNYTIPLVLDIVSELLWELEVYYLQNKSTPPVAQHLHFDSFSAIGTSEPNQAVFERIELVIFTTVRHIKHPKGPRNAQLTRHAIACAL